MTRIVRTLPFDAPRDHRPMADTLDPEAPSRPLVATEWIVTNGLGGYASGTVSGVITRRFHGVLISALPAPHGRTMMLNHVAELVHLAADASASHTATAVQLGAQARPDRHQDATLARLTEFRLEEGLPVWRFEHDDLVVEKRLVMPHGQNTVYVTYTLLSGSAAVLELEPWIHFRPHEGALELPLESGYALTTIDNRFEVSVGNAGLPPLRLQVFGGEGAFAIEGRRIRNVKFQIEKSRGYDASGDLYSPGHFRVPLKLGSPVGLMASSEDWATALALSAPEADACEQTRRARLMAAADPKARGGFAAELVLAADQFLMTPAGRIEDSARAMATGDEVRSVIAGYHWFTDWGRDTMIGLEGLTLTTGRGVEAGYILRTFAHYVRDGLIPNMFPEGKNGGLYHTADATLWFFHAVDRYLAHTGDRATLRQILPTLIDILEHHVKGTRFGIHVDPNDGLLSQGQEGYQLTWMDAKVGDLVVTPRRGKAVELNALYYNALRLAEGWVRDELGPDQAPPFREKADRAYASFNARFWRHDEGYLLDVIDVLDGDKKDDAAFRPNQILAISLANPVLDPSRWASVVQLVKDRLVTPVGLRSLAPGHPDYKPKYFGDLRARDLAYHQGTVWAWLIGPFIDAFLKVNPGERAAARKLLSGFSGHVSEACVGSISEIFDAEEPYTPRGCVAQAWSVAEVLRCMVKTAE